MLLEPKLIERLADILEGIPVTHATGGPSRLSSESREASVLVYHSGHSADGAGPVAGESPLLEINFFETDLGATVMVHSALGMVELHGVDEIRMLEATEEAAFFNHAGEQVSMLTISSHGVIQVYMNVAEMLATMDLSEIAERDLRAAVALKVFGEHAEVFRSA
ncbi:MAG: hypothetical protein Q8922_01325 [Bacteroidota bacterium]|nr:hypothetical protein [Bacteroidota bacterium]MDP4232132.1 hypothetical protein [Bacteroidota bacterium]MDP4241160.1 hypothetical protein [Bacteroidota bacterium]MDP4286552.1 hypothetical protein [Bacteroidota bacterium]